MATDFTEETAADAVIESFGAQTDPRLREVLTALVRHLHAFAREVELTIGEWEQAIDFLTRTGQKCDDDRQEFILLSDVLGLSMLAETISNRKFGVATESTVLGPFHVVESPVRELGDNIDLVGTGTPCVVTGRVVSVDGTPLPGATLDVWQANDQGFYDVQQPDVQPRTNGRGLFTADEQGRVLVPHDRAELLPDPDRRPGRRAAQGDRPARVPPGAHPLHRRRPRPPRADHAHLRGRQRVHRVRHGLRGEEVPGGGLRRGNRPGPGGEVEGGKVPFRHADFDIIIQPEAGRRSHSHAVPC